MSQENTTEEMETLSFSEKNAIKMFRNLWNSVWNYDLIDISDMAEDGSNTSVVQLKYIPDKTTTGQHICDYHALEEQGYIFNMSERWATKDQSKIVLLHQLLNPTPTSEKYKEWKKLRDAFVVAKFAKTCSPLYHHFMTQSQSVVDEHINNYAVTYTDNCSHNQKTYPYSAVETLKFVDFTNSDYTKGNLFVDVSNLRELRLINLSNEISGLTPTRHDLGYTYYGEGPTEKYVCKSHEQYLDMHKLFYCSLA